MSQITKVRHNHPLLTDQEAQVADLLLTGISQRRIAKLVGIDRSTVSAILSRSHVAKYQMELVQRALVPASVRAFATLERLLDHKSGYIRLEAAKDLMARAPQQPAAQAARGSMDFGITTEVVVPTEVTLSPPAGSPPQEDAADGTRDPWA